VTNHVATGGKIAEVVENRERREKAVVNGLFPDIPFPRLLAKFAPVGVVENREPFLTAFSPETPPFSRACYPVNLVRSCGSR
jgi:hypothetical protein